MPHDFVRFPELNNYQMNIHYFESPHKQITESFRAKVTKVIDGDTIRVRCNFRNFDFPIRFLDTAAPETNEPRGPQSQQWLEKRILGEDVDVEIDPHHRVEKWGRLLGKIVHLGMDVGEESIRAGHAVPWEQRKESLVPDFNAELRSVAI